MFQYAVFITLLAIGAGACTEGAGESEILPADTFVAVTADLFRNAGTPGTASPADSILTRAGVTRSAYDISVRWYSSDAGRWSDVMTRVVTLLAAPD